MQIAQTYRFWLLSLHRRLIVRFTCGVCKFFPGGIAHTPVRFQLYKSTTGCHRTSVVVCQQQWAKQYTQDAFKFIPSYEILTPSWRGHLWWTWNFQSSCSPCWWLSSFLIVSITIISLDVTNEFKHDCTVSIYF